MRPDEAILTDLSGQIERITYSAEDNGFTIARLKVRGQRDLVTVIGNLAVPLPGEILNMKGEWVNHPRYGRQFRVVRYETVVPASVHGIRKYLGSGLIKGIGPEMAGRIVNRFGKKTLDVIESNIEKLAEVDGIGSKRIEMIKKAWEDQRDIRRVMIFLQDHGVGPGYATRIFKRYGDSSIRVVKENPYRLATDIHGIGFATADRIAEQLGFPPDSEVRAEAGILYVLGRFADDGHVYYPFEPLVEKCWEILGVERKIIVHAMGKIAAGKKIVIEDVNEDLGPSKGKNPAVYLEKFHDCETGIADRLKRLLTAARSIRPIEPERALERVQRQLAFTLAGKQADAIKGFLRNKVMVITGGPGTGKTTLIGAILKISSRLGVKIMLAAPTGRAAKRMNETTGYEAKTIHRLLEFSLQKRGFQKNEENPLDCGLLIVDEASMIDTVLMDHLLKGIPLGATLILVGDVNQLPSVGAGNVLKDIIASGAVPVIELDEIFRQAKESRIIVNAHRINKGLFPQFQSTDSGSAGDFYFIENEDPDEVVKLILKLTTERIPRRFHLDPVDDIQILTPMNRGVVGAGNLNARLQEALNPGEDEVIRGGRNFRMNDKVMQIRNNYEKEVFNGDIGRITDIDADDQSLIVSFDGRKVRYDFADLDEIVLAYAISVHKSQGSEYPAVVIPLLPQHYMLLQRNLIYTAVTRGRKLVVLVGTQKALAIGLGNDRTQKRFTCLKNRLKGDGNEKQSD